MNTASECYYAGDGYELHLTELSYFKEGHLMLRAYGDYLGECHVEQSFTEPAVTRPEANYNVYRMTKNAAREDWELLGSTPTESFKDITLKSQEAGTYQYAVTALYGKGEKDCSPYLHRLPLSDLFKHKRKHERS